ncbi:MAG: FxsA family protein [Candidatus Omnitrophica bacterium]|nr:FxsA family protein [Candidatus Omnitrophota bacterium]
MFPYLFVLFIAFLTLELYVIIEVGSSIGAFNALVLLIVMGMVGAFLARIQGFIILNKINLSLERGQLPSSELMDGLMILSGGVLLIIPGFVSDVMGLCLLIPATRSIIKLFIQKKMETMIKTGQTVHIQRKKNIPGNYDDIDI